MKKRMKSLEDRIEKLLETNEALTGTIRTLKKQDHAHRTDADENRGDRNCSDSDSDDQNDSPMLFSSRKVCAKPSTEF